jgi:hypothetical protein
MENIWKNFDFEAKDQDEQKQLAEKFRWFTDIINEEIINIVGEVPINIKYSSGEDGWWYTKISVLLNNQSAFDVNLDKDDKLILFQPFSNMNLNRVGESMKLLVFDTKVIFREYIQQMIKDYLVPLIDIHYKNHALKNTGKIKQTSKIDLSVVTEEWFKILFNSVTEEEMNSEEAKKVKIETVKNGLRINFTLDCGRYGSYKNNSVEINDRGNIIIQLYDTPVEGAIEHRLEERITKDITK